MDFELSEEDKMLRKAAHEFLKNECPKRLIMDLEKDPKGCSLDLWRKMASLGWLGLPFPVEYGGTGASNVSLAVLLEEMGRVLSPVPFISTIICGLAILKSGSESQRQEYLPRIVSGQSIFSFAFTEPSATFEPIGIDTKALPNGDGYQLNGTKLFIVDAHISDQLLCVVRTSDTDATERATSLFIVPTNSPGIECIPLETIALDKQCEVRLTRVNAASEQMLGELNAGWSLVRSILGWGALAHSAFMVGAAGEVLDMTVAYAKERVQFGRPVGAFQAIQHKCADMLMALRLGRLLVYQASWKLDHSEDCRQDISMAKAWTSEAYRQICVHGHQIHGGSGLVLDHPMQLYSRHARALALGFGDANFHHEEVANALLS